jgi:hypothetical protein
VKIVGIDSDALKTRAESLRKELSDIEAVLRIVGGMSENVKPYIESAYRPPEMQRPMPIAPPITASRIVKNNGARKALILALHTGAASISELARGLVWDARLVREVARDMEIVGLCSQSAGGVFALTEKGREQAQWHIANPGYIHYCKNRINGVAANA